ncbi:acyltransferase family protein [Prevotella koreensis]
MKKNKMGKIVHIDRLKGLAILVMVIGHVYLFVLNNHSGPINRMITCNMPLFMFLSGVVVSYPISPKKWLNKACRFMSPSIFIGITCFLLLHNFVSWDNTLLSVIEFFIFHHVVIGI